MGKKKQAILDYIYEHPDMSHDEILVLAALHNTSVDVVLQYVHSGELPISALINDINAYEVGMSIPPKEITKLAMKHRRSEASVKKYITQQGRVRKTRVFLSDEEVEAARKALSSGASITALARKYRVSTNALVLSLD